MRQGAYGTLPGKARIFFEPLQSSIFLWIHKLWPLMFSLT
jgi:hypothetical protein